MKRMMTILLAGAVALGAALPVCADGEDDIAVYDTEETYVEAMIQAAARGDMLTGLVAQSGRDEMRRALGLESASFSFDDLNLLSKIMYAEAGSVWLSDEWKMCVGEVVLNRVASPEFPDNIRDVLEQEGQYYGKNDPYFDGLLPSERCVRLALRLLEGERVMNDLSVVFQANFKQGSGTFLALYDTELGWTYFGISSHPELYEREDGAAAILTEEFRQDLEQIYNVYQISKAAEQSIVRV